MEYKSKGVELIEQERNEQISKHGHHNDHEYTKDQLRYAAMYALTLDERYYPEGWSFWFHDNLMKKRQRMPEAEFYLECCKIAGALLAAEIDMLIEK